MLNGVRRWTRIAMRMAARDGTAASAGRSALVVAPHPDDETLGCGATILRKVAAGSAVTILVATDGRYSQRSAYVTPAELAELRHAEMTEAAARLGLAPHAVRWGGFVDGTLDAHEDELAALIGALLDELRPEELYATCAAEPHPDHAVVGRAARRAVIAAGAEVRLMEYPVWLWGSWPVRRGDRLRSTGDAAGRLLRRQVTKVVADDWIDGKLHALRAHESQLRRPEAVPAGEEWPTLPRSVLTAASEPVELFLPVDRDPSLSAGRSGTAGAPTRRAPRPAG